MTETPQNPVRLTPELQAEYQQIYNDPARKGSDAWLVAARGLFAAGIVSADPGHDADLAETVSTAETNTEQQTL